MENSKIESESITIKTKDGRWLGQIVLTSDGGFFSITDWGNFSYAWRDFSKEKSLLKFKEFLLQINMGYFADKIYAGIAYVTNPKRTELACERYAQNILPALKDALKNSIGQG